MTKEDVKLEEFRPAYESDDQWVLRREFLKRHWGKYPKNRLICLSQIFINMEFFGCKFALDPPAQRRPVKRGGLEVQRRGVRGGRGAGGRSGGGATREAGQDHREDLCEGQRGRGTVAQTFPTPIPLALGI